MMRNYAAENSRNGPRKPPRLRAACDNCNRAKVRCSGDRSGCARCREQRLPNCFYGISRVGKAPGSRRCGRQHACVRDDNADPQAIDEQQSSIDPLASYLSAWPASPMDIFDNALRPDELLHPAQNELAESDISQDETDLSSTSPRTDFWDMLDLPSSATALPSDPGSELRPQIDPLLGGLAMEHQVVTTSNTANSSSNNDNNSKATRDNDSGTLDGDEQALILDCSKLVSSLQAQVCAAPKTLDVMLSTNKQVTHDVQRLLQRRARSAQSPFYLLMAVILQQLVLLFQRSALPMAAAEDVPPSGILIGFGAYELDAREQELLRVRIVTKELRKTLQVADAAAAHARQSESAKVQQSAAMLDAVKVDLKAVLNRVVHRMSSQ